MRVGNISTRFFGLNKLDVNNYIDGLIKEHCKMLEELEKDYDWLVKEREKLLLQLEELKKEEIRYEDEVVESGAPTSSKTVDDALRRLEKTVALINMMADEEAAQLVQNANKKMEEYDRVIESLQNDIDEKKKRIEALLSDVLSILKDNIDNVTSKKDGKESLLDEIPKVKKTLRSDVAASDEEAEELEKVLENIRSDKITADGMSLSHLPKLLKFQKKHDRKDDDIEKPEEEVKSFFDSEIDDESQEDPFYDGIYDYEREILEQEDSHYGSIVTEPETIKDEQPKVQDSENSAPDSRDIKKMRNTLIIGKIAGEEVLDSNNNVIIPKGKVLSEEDVALAEREAKLPELIINMRLPK
ncbi:MAG: hypothetical protein BWY15_00523 [Firmicutes bacterium ADurb.Bin193]|nr:MAG: hypothetical protein BWY15_00523 [Firmicutes bacterium ADurb.Bin193]